ncbi:MAG: HIT family protein [Candidatus Pacearchaeota archaeon]
MEDCIFCKIIKGKIPCKKVYEDNKILAFLDISPINPGHTLVIPKKHFESIERIPESLLCELIKSVQKIAIAVTRAVSTDAFNINLNNGKAAGQLVPHMHFHIIPRFKNDGYEHWKGSSYKDKEMEIICEKIKKAL